MYTYVLVRNGAPFPLRVQQVVKHDVFAMAIIVNISVQKLVKSLGTMSHSHRIQRQLHVRPEAHDIVLLTIRMIYCLLNVTALSIT
jgi:predicted amino acid-binding ACT domain protein